MVRDLVGAPPLDTPRTRGEIPDALAQIAPEPEVVTAPAPSEIGSTPPPPPPPPPVPADPALAELEEMADNAIIGMSPVVEPDINEAGDVTIPLPTEELDSTNLQWDGRIHSSGKTKTAKGVWTRRRGIDDKLYSQVLAELATQEVGSESNPPEAQEIIPDAASAGFGGNGSSEMTWPDVVQVVMKAKVQELVSQAQLDQQAATMGVEGGFNNLVSRPDLYAQYIMELGI